MTRPLPSQLRSRGRVEAIFEATRSLLRDGGIVRCSVAAISAEAGISPASLYRYFPDATSIIHALAKESLDEVHRTLEDFLGLLQNQNDVEVVTRKALAYYLSLFANDRALQELWRATLADPQLVALNIEDSRRNGLLFAKALAPYSDLPLSQLQDRWFLLSHMIGAAVGLMIDVSARQSKRLQKELETLLFQALK